MGLLLAEGLARLIPEPEAPTPPLLRGELTRPGEHHVRVGGADVTVHVNRDGFADREWGPKAGARVVVIGDSFVQAAQVPQEAGYGRVLDALLPDVEVLSMGVPGAGPATALGVLTQHALPRQPDVVLLGFLLGNDVMNSHPLLESKDDKPFYRLVDGALEPVTAEAFVPPPWSALVGRLWRARQTRKIEAEKLALGRGMPIDLRVYDPRCFGGQPDATCDAWADAWAVTDALLAEMARRCADAGVRFGVVLFPDAVVGSRAGREDAARRWPEAGGWDYTAAWGRAVAMASARAPTLDLLPAFQAADDGTLFIPGDGHWTAKGHRVAAEGTAGFVTGLRTE